MKKLGCLIVIVGLLFNFINDNIFYGEMYVTKEIKKESNTNSKILNNKEDNKEKKAVIKSNSSNNLSTNLSGNNEYDIKDDNKLENIKDMNKVIIDLNIKREEYEEIKYGTTITKIVEIKTYTYEDLTTRETRNEYYQYDYNFNATTVELIKEAKDILNQNLVISKQIIAKTNEIRKQINVPLVEEDYNLTLAATIRALEMAYSKKVEHIRPNNKRWNTVLNNLNIAYDYAGENIGSYYKSAQDIVNAWKESNGHYLNMINKEYKKIGVGYISLNGLNYWVQIFTD